MASEMTVDFSDVFDHVAPAVVYISIVIDAPGKDAVALGSGSGVILQTDLC